MTAAQSLGALLAGINDLTDLVGTRIWQAKRPQESELPAVSFTEIPGGEVPRTMNQAPGTVKRRNSVWQIDAWAATIAEARAVRDAVFAGIDAYHNDGAVVGEVSNVALETPGGTDFDDSAKQYFATDDYRIWWLE